MTRPPSSAQSAWSQPEEKLQEPLMRKPPSTGVTLPVGAYEEQIRVDGSVPHTSSWARGS